MRIAATSILNVNLSAANIDTLAQTMDSWRKQMEHEEKAMRLYEVLFLFLPSHSVHVLLLDCMSF